MQRWEYKLTNGLTEEEMNKLGDEGWELTAIIGEGRAIFLMFFKRRKS
jgi:hypothetical protein